MPARQLPDSANLEQLKKQAKDLLKAYRTGDPDAHQAFNQHHTRPVAQDAAKLTDAQYALSRSYGFDSWPLLRKQVVGRQLRSAIWNQDPASVRRALDDEPGVLNEAGPHPRFGGQPTPIQIAAERGNAELVELLLDAGAELEGDTESYGWSPLQLAAHWGHHDVIQVLKARGAALDIFSAVLLGDLDTASARLKSDSTLAAAPGLNTSPPLHFAGTPEIATLLIDHGAPLDSIDSMGNTPLASAVGRGERGRPVAELLLRSGSPADPCLLAALGNDTALGAIISAESDMLRFVGKIGLHSVTGTPLHAAAQHGQISTVQLLLKAGADPSARASAGQTALHLCALEAIAKLLVEAGADPAAIDDEHKTTPLTWARIGIDIHGESPERRSLVSYLEGLQ